MAENILKFQAFKLKGRLYTFTVIHLINTDEKLFKAQLKEVIAQAPKLFNNAPVVIDCSGITDENLNLDLIIKHLKSFHLVPIAIQGATPLVNTLAQCKGFAVLNATSSNDKLIFDKVQIENNLEGEKAAESLTSTKIITLPVRSGQQIVNQEGDLIILASVSPGAELLAAGHIHIYGTLRGRALAGIKGKRNARIFCQSLEAELVSISGCYRLQDAIEPLQQPCQIFLSENQNIQIELL